ncbi:MAG TPA: hypothetical protein VGN07_12440 [Steroidobacteraceae bacterium]|jgi:hypothetical protein
MIIVGGFLLLSLCLLGARALGGALPSLATGAKAFLPIWLVVAAANMWLGVSRAGYSVAEELPIFLLIFALPALAAAFTWWKFSH